MIANAKIIGIVMMVPSSFWNLIPVRLLSAVLPLIDIYYAIQNAFSNQRMRKSVTNMNESKI